jgi:hypothetical protein
MPFLHVPARLFLARYSAALPLVLIGLVAVLSHARAHSWYPYICCSQLDCYPISIPHSEIERRETGWFLKKERITIPFEDARPSPDHQFHICRNEAGKGKLITPADHPPCFWAPRVQG